MRAFCQTVSVADSRLAYATKKLFLFLAFHASILEFLPEQFNDSRAGLIHELLVNLP